MLDNPQKENLLLFLAQQTKPVDAMTLVKNLGIHNSKPEICQRVIAGITRDDNRFLFEPQRGWTINRAVQQGVLNRESGNSSPELTSTSQLVVALALRFDPTIRRHFPLIHQIGAQKLQGDVRGEKLGPFTLRYGHEQDEKLMSSSLPVHHDQGIQKLYTFCSETPIIIWRDYPGVAVINQLALHAGYGTFSPAVITLSHLAKFLFPQRRRRCFEDFLEDALRKGYAIEDISYELDALIDFYLECCEKINETTVAGILGWLLEQNLKKHRIDFEQYQFDTEFLRNIPVTPGIYKMINAVGDIIYVGKSRNLNQRVCSYFYPQERMTPKLKALLGCMSNIEICETGSELAAEVLEARLILKHKPPFNVKIEFKEEVKGTDNKNLLLILPATADQEREIHLAGKRGAYTSVTLTGDRLSIDQCLQAMTVFFKTEKSSESDSPNSFEAKISRFSHTIFLRWWRRNKQAIPLYDFDRFSTVDLERILRGAQDHAFTVNTVFQ
ncbi:nucleotide excision repair endonuclease [candidate division CSSED10-310 bacterium]|uniref:Nucleotide excision repair endonuclease n=1 Tax=candidate division CSSED10-310 bacterium TaxID=2855610 RepID=A0ABV6Z247_UNCC1